MIKFLNLLFALCLITSLKGQSNTEFNKDSVRYLTPNEEAFMIDKETKSLFKITPFGILFSQFSNQQFCAFTFEQKIGKAFSILPSVTVARNEFLGDTDLGFSSSLNMRYYYHMKRRIEAGIQANNLTGKYISFGTFYTDNRNIKLNGFDFQWGSQKRFLNYGTINNFFSFSYFRRDLLDSEITAFNQSGYFQNFSIGFSSNISLAFGKKYDISDNAKCVVLGCNTDRYRGWKINISQLGRLSLNNKKRDDDNELELNLFLSPNLSYEHKISTSSFSLNHTAVAGLSLTSFEGDVKFQVNNIYYSPTLRYYFLQKQNILKGKSGNNLSGVYAFSGPRIRYLISADYTEIFGLIGIGYQKELFEEMYIDVDFGYSKFIESFEENRSSSNYLSLSMKVGIMFDQLF